MNTTLKILAASLFIVSANLGFTQSIVYDNLSTGAQAGYSEANANNPIFGDALTLSSGGLLSFFGCTLFNSSSGGNTGIITNGTMLISFYDNTVPYAGGVISNPLLGTATVTWDFSGDGGLSAGFFSSDLFDLTSLNINLPQNIFVTQQFTELVGNSTRNGIVVLGNATTGSSPATLFLSSSATAAGLYTLGTTSNQIGYQVQVVPEPTSLALAGLGLATMLALRRRK